ncbi:MAG TPA: ferritin-like domain-containing protein, partial [Myxococcota bacterium]|nr:ferritin-like domain-containing protein [Myxococcota bacterium]
DEARHVAFGLSHLCYSVEQQPELRPRLAAAIRARHDSLRESSGLNEEVFDALLLLAAGSWAPEDLERGWDRVTALKLEMDQGRQFRLRKLGFSEEEAAALSVLHTRNFM